MWPGGGARGKVTKKIRKCSLKDINIQRKYHGNDAIGFYDKL